MLKRIGVNVCVAASLFVANVAQAADFLVPQQFPTIQSAIDIAPDGSRILVSPGTYTENLLIQRSLALISTGGAHATKLKGLNRGAVVAARGDGTQHVTIQGFTITGGFSTFDDASVPGAGLGGGIHLQEVDALVSDNVVTGNTSCLGLGIAANVARVQIVRNRIYDNKQDPSCNGADGGGIFFNSDTGKGSLISQNEITRHRIGGRGAGIYASFITAAVISSNVIADNTVETESGGGVLLNQANVVMTGNIIRDNSAGIGGGIAIFPDTPTRMSIRHNLLANNKASQGSAMFIQLFDAQSLILEHNIAKGSSPDSLFSCSVQPFVIKRSNVLLNIGGPEIDGTCIR